MKKNKIQELSAPPNVFFPVKNDITGNTVWYEIGPSGTGCYITVHKSTPQFDTVGWSPQTAMVAVHVDYFVSEDTMEEHETLKVQLWDEQTDPYGDPAWCVPEAIDRWPGSSIVLVKDVQAWQPPEDE